MFKNINEVKPAHYVIYNKKTGLHTERYWKLESKPHVDDFETTCVKVKELLENSMERQIIPGESLCTFLSGGLDSSILSLYTSKQVGKLNTYSVDYIDNDKNFVKSDFQPDSDKYYIDIMTDMLKTNHSTIYIDTPDLVESLKEAMIARDLPGMADIDVSLMLFCKKVKERGENITISGESADEIFGGYPWFFREDSLKSGTFPWSIALEEREKLLHPDISQKIDLKEYIERRYNESLSEVEILEVDSKELAEKRKISH